MLPKPEAIDAKPEISPEVQGAFDMNIFADEPGLKATYHACISRTETFKKSGLSLGLILTMSILLGSVPNIAKAVAASHAGAICRASQFSQEAYVWNAVYGVVNTSTASSATVVCPLVRTSTGSSVSVYVDGYLLANGQAITCILYSVDYSGNILGSQYFSSPKGGTFDIYASVPSANVWSTATVECTLPPAELAYGNYPAIFDIDVVE